MLVQVVQALVQAPVQALVKALVKALVQARQVAYGPAGGLRPSRWLEALQVA